MTMALCMFSNPPDDESSIAPSSVGHSEVSGSTVWGPGALSGKALKAIGELGLDLFENMVIRRRLSTIKKTFNEYPSLFVDPDHSQEPETVRKMERDLQELRNEIYPAGIRQSAIALFIDICTLRKTFNYIKGIWNFNPRIFIKPKGSAEERILARTYVSLYQLSGPLYSPGIRRMALSVVHRLAGGHVSISSTTKDQPSMAEYEAVELWAEKGHNLDAFEKSLKIGKGRWKELENNVMTSVRVLRRRGLTI